MPISIAGGGGTPKNVIPLPKGYIYESQYTSGATYNGATCIPWTVKFWGTMERWDAIKMKTRGGGSQTAFQMGGNNSNTTGSTGLSLCVVPIAELCGFDFEWIKSKTLGVSTSFGDSNLFYVQYDKGLGIAPVTWIRNTGGS